MEVVTVLPKAGWEGNLSLESHKPGDLPASTPEHAFEGRAGIHITLLLLPRFFPYGEPGFFFFHLIFYEYSQTYPQHSCPMAMLELYPIFSANTASYSVF